CDLIGGPALWIKQDLVPADDRHFLGRRSACGEQSLFGFDLRQKIQAGIDFLNPGWHFYVDCPVIVKGPAPLQELPVARKLEPGQVDDRPAGGMLAGNPLRVVESQRSGSRWNPELRMKNLSRRLRRIECDSNLRCWSIGGKRYRADHENKNQ